MVFDGRGECDGVSITTGLHPRVDLLAWLTSADPQISMVMEEGRHPSLSEHLGIPVGDHRDDGGGAMSHHHQRERCLALHSLEEKPPKDRTFRFELHGGPTRTQPSI
jgi:hypothetical protein